MRRLFVGVMAAVVAGLVLGAVARLLMRLVTLVAGQPGAFSLEGTLGIVTVFVAAAMPGAVFAAFWKRRGRSLPLVAGSLLLCVPTIGVGLTDLAAVGELTGPQWVGAGAATLVIVATILALPVVTLRLLRIGLASTAPGYRGAVRDDRAEIATQA